MSKHIHADLMMEYAKDAATSDKPWELWEFKNHGDTRWLPCEENPKWISIVSYRRKRETRTINGIEVPAPVRSIDHTKKYWYIEYAYWEKPEVVWLRYCPFALKLQKIGLLFESEEDAVANLEAMRKF